MRIDAVSNRDNMSHRGVWQRMSNAIESTAATIPTKTSQSRKTISVELHNAMVKLTAYRVALLFSVLSGCFGYKVADRMSDKDTENFANAVQSADIDTDAKFEIKDMNNDGTADLVLHKKDGSKVILDLANSNVHMETTGFKKVE